MRRFSAFLFIFLFSLTLLLCYAHALTEDEKRALFLKAHEEMEIDTGSHAKPTPHHAARPKPARHHAHQTESSETHANHHPAHEEEEATPVHHHAAPQPTPENPANRQVGAPAHGATPSTPNPTPAPNIPAAPITITKSGYEQSTGEVEPPPPTPEGPHGFWLFNLFRSSPSEGGRYLTATVRRAIDHPNAPVLRARWRYIVVHNSGTNQGNARAFDYYHRHVRHMPNGLAYHFVIDNGHGGPDGHIEIGPRWRAQLQGGHVHSDYLNNISLGICLVGDFNRHHPTKAQLEALQELIRYLERRVGKVDGHWPLVVPHRAINPPRWQTDCPGALFPYSWLRSNFPPPSSSVLNTMQYDRRVPSSNR